MGKINSFILSIILILFGQLLFAQDKPVSYSNLQNAYYNKDTSNAIKDGPLKGLNFFEPKVNEITLNTDSTFDFWSRPNVSCFTWQEYKGTWKKLKDTILFYDNYEIAENDVRVKYKKTNKPTYHLRFSTDQHSRLKSREIKVSYIYDFNSNLKDCDKIFYLNAKNEIVIDFAEIPNRAELAAMDIEYMLSNTNKRRGYLTENKILNEKTADLPNMIAVEFVEKPKSETVYRTIKALVRDNKLTILSTTKSKATLPDGYDEIAFEDGYALEE